MVEISFEAVLGELKKLHAAKSKDYGEHNLYACEKMGIPAITGVIIRMSDKLSRLQHIAKTGQIAVKQESVEDTLLDLAVYAINGIILIRGRENDAKEKEEPNEKQEQTEYAC